MPCDDLGSAGEGVRVAMVVSNAYGPDPRVHKEALSLADAGYDVVVYAYDRAGDGEAVTSFGPNLRVERIRGIRIRPRQGLRQLLGLVLFRAEVCRRLARRPVDIVHCHDGDTCLVGLWWKLVGGKLAGVEAPRFVFDAHDLFWLWLLGSKPTWWRRVASGAARQLGRLYARTADLLITVTEAKHGYDGLAEVFQAWGCRPLVVMNASIPPASFRPLPAHFTVGYVGSVRSILMFEWLLEACGRLPPGERPRLLIAGGGGRAGEVASRVRQRATSLGMDAVIQGPFSLGDLDDLICRTSVQYCVYSTHGPNADRSMPVKLFDSIARGRPVIGSSGTLMGAWIESEHWGWTVRPGDAAGLAEVLSKARRTIATWCVPPRRVPTWNGEAKKLLETYETLLTIECWS